MIPPPDTDDPARLETVVAEAVSFEDFLRINAEDHAEWLIDKVTVFGSKSVRHQRILMFLLTILNLFVSSRVLGRVMMMGVPMVVGPDRPAREPDLMVILEGHLYRIKENYIDGPVDIVVEIASPETVIRDRGDKFKEYLEAGVPEYWFFDPLSREAYIYELGTDGHYHSRPLDAQGGITSGVLPGFAFDPTILWDDENLIRVNLGELVQQMMQRTSDS